MVHCVPERMNETKLVCIWASGEGWAGNLAGNPDLLIYCSDGVLATTQVVTEFSIIILSSWCKFGINVVVSFGRLSRRPMTQSGEARVADPDFGSGKDPVFISVAGSGSSYSNCLSF